MQAGTISLVLLVCDFYLVENRSFTIVAIVFRVFLLFLDSCEVCYRSLSYMTPAFIHGNILY